MIVMNKLLLAGVASLGFAFGSAVIHYTEIPFRENITNVAYHYALTSSPTFPENIEIPVFVSCLEDNEASFFSTNVQIPCNVQFSNRTERVVCSREKCEDYKVVKK